MVLKIIVFFLSNLYIRTYKKILCLMSKNIPENDWTLRIKFNMKMVIFFIYGIFTMLLLPLFEYTREYCML